MREGDQHQLEVGVVAIRTGQRVRVVRAVDPRFAEFVGKTGMVQAIDDEFATYLVDIDDDNVTVEFFADELEVIKE